MPNNVLTGIICEYPRFLASWWEKSELVWVHSYSTRCNGESCVIEQHCLAPFFLYLISSHPYYAPFASPINYLPQGHWGKSLRVTQGHSLEEPTLIQRSTCNSRSWLLDPSMLVIKIMVPCTVTSSKYVSHSERQYPEPTVTFFPIWYL